jgi:hypothetical protein
LQFSRIKIDLENSVRGDTSQLNENCRGSKLINFLVLDTEPKSSVSVLSHVRQKKDNK